MSSLIRITRTGTTLMLLAGLLVACSDGASPAEPEPVASGRFSITVTDTFTYSVSGSASFESYAAATEGYPLLALWLINGDEQKIFINDAAGRPPTGTREIGPPAAGGVSPLPYVIHLERVAGVEYQRESTRGELRVDVSTPRALIGAFWFEAPAADGRQVRVEGTFSAACRGICR